MDRKAKDIIGLPVVTFNRGTKIYDVEDLIIDPERRQVLALVVQEKQIFHSGRAIPFGRISAIGPDAVIVPDGKAVMEINRDQVLKRLYNDQNVRGLRVLSEDGRRMGTVSDMLVDDKTGEIRGYYVSIGRVLDVTQGTRWLPAENVTNMGMRVLYVSAESANELDAQLGGWSGALEGAGGGLKTAGSKANDQLVQLGNQARVAGASLNDQLAQVGQQTTSALSSQTAGMLIGREAHQQVAAPDGTVIVEPGDEITSEKYEQARAAGRLPQLALAAGAGPVRQHAGSFQDQASQGWGDMRSEAQDLWGRLTGRYGTGVDQADERVMERRIKSALGRPSTRVILDADDNVILNTGEIITNRAVEGARDAGVLDILVDSVYTEKPQLTLDDLRAPEAGSASLERQDSAVPAASSSTKAATVTSETRSVRR